MKKIIHNLRQQPHEIRIYILYGLTLLAGAILFTLWIYSFGASTEEPSFREGLKNDVAPFGALKSNLIDGYNSLNTNQ
jgi:hypothetical protein